MSRATTLYEAIGKEVEYASRRYFESLEALGIFYSLSDEEDQVVMDAYPDEMIEANYNHDEEEDGDWNDYLSDKVAELAKRYKNERR